MKLATKRIDGKHYFKVVVETGKIFIYNNKGQLIRENKRAYKGLMAKAQQLLPSVLEAHQAEVTRQKQVESNLSETKWDVSKVSKFYSSRMINE
jgi:hypothetical protein